MKRLLAITIILISFSANGQTENIRNKMLWGVNFSPDLNFRTLSGEPTIDNVLIARNNIEIPNFGFTTGVNVSLPLAQKLSLETGIQYSDRGYRSEKQQLIFEMPNPNNPTTAEAVYSYHSIGIPLKAKFLFGMNRIRFHSTVGLVTNFLLAAKSVITLEYTNASPEKRKLDMIDDLHRVDLSLNVAAGVDYSISQKILLVAEPTFRYGLLKAAKSQVSEHLWSLGLNLGVYYSFK